MVVLTSGGIGADHDLIRANWPPRLGRPPESMITGVPAYVDGRMLGIAERAGASLINRDRMWHYVEGIRNWKPVWPEHAIRILPGPSSMWFDGSGCRLPAPLYPGLGALGTLKHLRQSGHDHSWFILTQKIVEKEFALSGSEQNPDLTGRSIPQVLGRVRPGAAAPVVEMQPRLPIRCGEVCTNRHIRVGRAKYRSHVPPAKSQRPYACTDTGCHCRQLARRDS